MPSHPPAPTPSPLRADTPMAPLADTSIPTGQNRTAPALRIRRFTAAHEPSWLRCRVLAFLDSAYYDDVRRVRPRGNDLELVAVIGQEVVGILDIEYAGELATIDTIAVHPDHRRRGIADALMDEALALLPAEVTTLDAWTREDAAANAWYLARGMTASEHYLHVYWNHDDAPEQGAEESDAEGSDAEGPDAGHQEAQDQEAQDQEARSQGTRDRGAGEAWTSATGLLRPISVFAHARLEHEAELRARFARVHVCRRYSLPLTTERADAPHGRLREEDRHA